MAQPNAVHPSVARPGVADQDAAPTPAQSLALYERMLLIRRMEEKLSADAAAGKLPGAVHLYIGQEAVAAGVCMQLKDTDWITSTHRGHGHFLGKGGDPKAMMAEIWGKKTGICKGMGGSMHVADLTKGILGANGIVGGGLAISVGAAFGAKLSGAGRVAVCFFGDGASNQGVFMECLNVSTLWQLPVVFVCEHNHFSEFTRAEQVTSGQIVNRAKAFGIHTAVVDGNDVEAVWRATSEAVARARRGDGPCFIEAETYRIKGHMEFEKELLAGGKYREAEEIEHWRGRDPIARWGDKLVKSGVATAAKLEEISGRIARTVDEAVAFSESSEPADPELVFSIMFAGQRP
jgi:pyruvate dehydrogenase E1 component alpha subunit